MYDIAQAGRRPRPYWITASAVALSLAAWTASALGQVTDTQKAEPAGEKPTARTHPQNPELWDVEQMMEDAVLQISRRYNLNKAQENYTRMLLKERVRSFLDEYEDDVRQLLAESIKLQTHPKDASIQNYIDWAKRAKPVYEAAQTAILNGNSEWREILDVDQRKIHDRDLDQMMRNFDQVSRVMDQWEEGKGVAVADSTQSGGSNGTVSQTKPPPVIKYQNVEDNWMMYVDKFIQVYHFDEKQANSARAKIHKEFHDKAVAYRERKASEFEAINAALSNPKFDKGNVTRPRKLLEQRRKLEQPVYTLFLQMHERLLMLADSKQLAAADETGKQELEKWKATFSGEQAQQKIRKNRGASNRPDEKPATSAPTTTAPAPEKTEPAVEKDKPAAEAKPEPTAEEKPQAEPQPAPQEPPGAGPVPAKEQPAPSDKPAEKTENTPAAQPG